MLNFNLLTMAKIISILNYKGGVAKTTTTANLGTALWILGKKVLIVDTDIQCNLSFQFDFDQSAGDATLHDWLLNDCNPPVYDRYNGLHFIPSGSDEAFDEKLSKLYHNEDVLRDHIQVLKDYFDYILIDCAPKKGLVNVNAMNAADTILIPVVCDSFSLQGMQSLIDSIEHVKKRMNPKLGVEGILITKYEKNTKISKAVMKFFTDPQQFPLADKIFDTKIRKNVKFDESPISNKTCFEIGVSSNGAEDYLLLAEELTGEKRPDNWKYKVLEAWLEDETRKEDADVTEQLETLKKKEHVGK